MGSRVIEPEVKFVQSVELILPPGLMGNKTGVLEELVTVVIFEVVFWDSSFATLSINAEFELSRESTFCSKELILSVIPEVSVIGGWSLIIAGVVLPGIKNQRAMPMRIKIGVKRRAVFNII